MNHKIEKIIKILKGLQGEIENNYKAEIVGLFGSYVRGEEKENSDVDILVKFSEGATLFNFTGLGNYLEKN